MVYVWLLRCRKSAFKKFCTLRSIFDIKELWSHSHFFKLKSLILSFSALFLAVLIVVNAKAAQSEGGENRKQCASSRHLNELEAKITKSTLNLIVLDSRMIDVIRDHGCLPMFCPGIFFWQQILHAKITFFETVPCIRQVHTEQRMRQLENGLCPSV